MGIRYAKIGDRIRGRDTTYLIVDFIGEGGMAQVFKAVETDSGLSVAVKIMKRENYESAETYRREFVVLRGLMHPYIVKLYDFIDTPEYVYVVMEYLPGGSMKEKIGREDTIHLIEDIVKVAFGIDYAHANGVIHRDIKPANVLYDTEDEPRITDFGIAISMFSHTVKGRYAGTPAYMAPEQIKGEPLDPRTDIYQLGLMLYEVMTGHLPFEPDNSQEFMQWLEKGLTHEPSLYEENIPFPFDRVFIKSLSATRDNRYSRALDFAVEVINACMRSGWNISDDVMRLFKDVMSRLVINVEPEDSVIYIDDAHVGTAPVVMDSIFPGSKRLSVRRPMFREIDVDIWLEPAETTYLDYEMEPDGRKRVGPIRLIKPVECALATAYQLFVVSKGIVAKISLDGNISLLSEISGLSSGCTGMYRLGSILVIISGGELFFLDMPTFRLYHTGVYMKDVTKVVPGALQSSLGILTSRKVFWIQKDGEIVHIKGHYENIAVGSAVIALYDGNTLHIRTPFSEKASIPVKSWVRSLHILDKLGLIMVDYVNDIEFISLDGDVVDTIPASFRYAIKSVKNIKGSGYFVSTGREVALLLYENGQIKLEGAPISLPSGTHRVVLSKYVPLGPIVVRRNRNIAVIDILDKDHYRYDIERIPGGFTTFVKEVYVDDPYLTVILTNDTIFVYNTLAWSIGE